MCGRFVQYCPEVTGGRTNGASRRVPRQRSPRSAAAAATASGAKAATAARGGAFGGQHAAVAVPMLPRRRYQRGDAPVVAGIGQVVDQPMGGQLLKPTGESYGRFSIVMGWLSSRRKTFSFPHWAKWLPL